MRLRLKIQRSYKMLRKRKRSPARNNLNKAKLNKPRSTSNLQRKLKRLKERKYQTVRLRVKLFRKRLKKQKGTQQI